MTGSGEPRGVSRRALFGGGAVAVIAGLGGFATGRGSAPGRSASVAGTTGGATAGLVGARTVPFYGARQAGITTDPQAYIAVAALDLVAGANRDTVIRLMRVWSDDAPRLAAGKPALADAEPDLARVPARLTVTVGYGPGLFAAAGITRPPWCAQLPAYKVDRLEERWSGGDVVVQVCADDELTVAHALRTLLRGATSMASVRWVQRGFRRAVGSEPAGTTMRNLMGQVDGTRNPDVAAEPGLVWSDGSGSWPRNGSSMVIRRIAMNLDTWDELDREGKEAIIGRRLSTGAPLTGRSEHDEPDLTAVNDLGFTVIDSAAHIRRARTDNLEQRFLRRGYNYDDAPTSVGSVSASGLIFIAFQADVARQYVPIQDRVAQLDLLNTWTTPVGSAVFAIPPGCREGEFLGQSVLT